MSYTLLYKLLCCRKRKLMFVSTISFLGTSPTSRWGECHALRGCVYIFALALFQPTHERHYRNLSAVSDERISSVRVTRNPGATSILLTSTCTHLSRFSRSLRKARAASLPVGSRNFGTQIRDQYFVADRSGCVYVKRASCDMDVRGLMVSFVSNDFQDASCSKLMGNSISVQGVLSF